MHDLHNFKRHQQFLLVIFCSIRWNIYEISFLLQAKIIFISTWLDKLISRVLRATFVIIMVNSVQSRTLTLTYIRYTVYSQLLIYISKHRLRSKRLSLKLVLLSELPHVRLPAHPLMLDNRDSTVLFIIFSFRRFTIF